MLILWGSGDRRVYAVLDRPTIEEKIQAVEVLARVEQQLGRDLSRNVFFDRTILWIWWETSQEDRAQVLDVARRVLEGYGFSTEVVGDVDEPATVGASG
uniref:Uncharacterized protein n=1 Tax=viral metagenome TaxID=1070528 RepID=A0A6M3MFM8_9ZZZZ